MLLAEVEDVAGRIGTARLELPVALPTYGQAAPMTFGVGQLANDRVLLSAFVTIGGPGEDAAAKIAGGGESEDAMISRTGADGPVALKSLYSVLLQVVGGGSVSGTVPAGSGTIYKFANCTYVCKAIFDTSVIGSSELTLTATPATGYVFTGWLGAACPGTGTCKFTVSGPATITATFAPTTMAPGGILPVTFDIDANLRQDALTDALLATRYLSGLSEAAIVSDALGAGAQRGGAGQPTISGYLGAIRPVLDVDGNGVADVLTDGLLISRYQFGLRGASLITGAVGAGAARTTAAQIEAYLASPCGAGIDLHLDRKQRGHQAGHRRSI